MKQSTHHLAVSTRGAGLYEVTSEVAAWLARADIQTGLLTVFVQHTSASIVVQENADPGVVADLNRHFARLAPKDPDLYEHTLEGPDDMPAHIRAALTATQVSVPVIDGRMALGTWQGIYVFEHRDQPHRRRLSLAFIVVRFY